MGCLLVKIEPVKANLKVNFGLVCTIGGSVEYLSCSDLGYLKASDKGYIIVKKEQNNGIQS